MMIHHTPTRKHSCWNHWVHHSLFNTISSAWISTTLPKPTRRRAAHQPHQNSPNTSKNLSALNQPHAGATSAASLIGHHFGISSSKFEYLGKKTLFHFELQASSEEQNNNWTNPCAAHRQTHNGHRYILFFYKNVDLILLCALTSWTNNCGAHNTDKIVPTQWTHVAGKTDKINVTWTTIHKKINKFFAFYWVRFLDDKREISAELARGLKDKC